MIRVKDYDNKKPINGYKVTIKGTGKYSNFNFVKNHNSGESVSIDLLRGVVYTVVIVAKDYNTCNYWTAPTAFGNTEVLEVSLYKKSNYKEINDCSVGFATGTLDSACYNDGECDLSKWFGKKS